MEPHNRKQVLFTVRPLLSWETGEIGGLLTCLIAPNIGSKKKREQPNFRRTSIRIWIWKCTSNFVNRWVSPYKQITRVTNLIINPSPTMFDSATNPMITGGQFTAHQGDRTNVTINIDSM